MTTSPAVLRPTPEPGILLRLSAPLQSWGSTSHFNERDTALFPTRSGLIGLLASALGRRRHEPPDDLTQLSATVRIDRPGILLRDLHTVGGGLPSKATVTTADGGKRPRATATLRTHRHYLADAAFTVALTGQPDNEDHRQLLLHCAHALRFPRWPLYLGRRSCPPEGPLLLGVSDDALHHLIHLPLAAPAPTASATGAIDFTADRPLNRLPLPPHLADLQSIDPDEVAHPAGAITDEPVTFHPRQRTYRARPLYRRTLHLPHSQYAGLGTKHLTTLSCYLTEHLTDTEGSTR